MGTVRIMTFTYRQITQQSTKTSDRSSTFSRTRQEHWLKIKWVLKNYTSINNHMGIIWMLRKSSIWIDKRTTYHLLECTIRSYRNYLELNISRITWECFTCVIKSLSRKTSMEDSHTTQVLQTKLHSFTLLNFMVVSWYRRMTRLLKWLRLVVVTRSFLIFRN